MNGETTWFTSDTHFGHSSVIKYCSRPYRDSYEMDNDLIERWNDRVRPDDTVFHMGDFSFHNARYTTEKILSRLNGHLHLIEGNHDKQTSKIAHLFASVSTLTNIKVDNQMIVLCHFPLLSWEGRHRGWWHLHGHCHGNIPDDLGARRLDVGVDINAYAPVSFQSIRNKLVNREDRPVDHHKRGKNNA